MNLDRNLYNTPSGSTSAVDMAYDIPAPGMSSGINEPDYSRTTEFPQPSIIGMGYVTSAGAKDTTRFFFSQNWTVAKNSSGNYTITHNIGDIAKYIPVVTPIAASDCNLSINNLTATTIDVLTFNQAGTATDTAFGFVFYLIP